MMKTNLEILPFSAEYADKVALLTIEAWTPIREEYRRLLGDELYELEFSNWQEEKTRKVLEKMSTGRGFVAIIDGELAGFIHYSMSENGLSGEIGNNAVSSKFRGQGIAQVMYSFVLEKMKSEGAEYATVVTGLDDAHAPARRSYEKAGFERALPSVKYYKKI